VKLAAVFKFAFLIVRDSVRAIASSVGLRLGLAHGHRADYLPELPAVDAH
jgi:hypothetical protein